MVASKVLHRTIFTLGVVCLITIIGALYFNTGLEPVPILQTLAVVITAIFIAMISKRKKLGLGKLSVSMLVSVALLYSLSLTGFFTMSFVEGGYDNGGTWAPDRSIGTGLLYSLDTSDFIAALFGYNCNGSYGPNCSGSLYMAGFVISEATLIGGVVIGNVLVGREASTRKP
jgi:hypothetical protein